MGLGSKRGKLAVQVATQGHSVHAQYATHAKRAKLMPPASCRHKSGGNYAVESALKKIAAHVVEDNSVVKAPRTPAPTKQKSDERIQQLIRADPEVVLQASRKDDETTSTCSDEARVGQSNPKDSAPPIALQEKKGCNQAGVTRGGIANIGNTCYISAVINCLLHNQIFRRELELGAKTQKPIHTALGELMEMHPRSNQRALIQSLKDTLGFGRDQQDVHEFYTKLTSELSEESSNVVDNTFLGSFEKILVCTKCGESANISETFTSLSLPITQTASVPLSVRSIMDCFFTGEVVNKNCENCHNAVSHTATNKLKRFPAVLALHIKRLVAEQNPVTGAFVSKKCDSNVHIDTKLSFRDHEVSTFESLEIWNNSDTPLEFDVGQHSPRNKECLQESLAPKTPDQAKLACGPSFPPGFQGYNLKAVVSHLGGPTSGHYIANVSDGRRWFRYNDEAKQTVSEEAVITEEGGNSYMLFYHKEL